MLWMTMKGEGDRFAVGIEIEKQKERKQAFDALVQRSEGCDLVDGVECSVLGPLDGRESCVLIRKSADNGLDQKAWRLRHE